MQKIKMIAKRPFAYGGQQLKRGDEFEAARQDARLLHAVGRAVEAAPLEKSAEPMKAPAADEHVEEAQDAPSHVARKDMAAEGEDAPEKPVRKKRAYKRRDMKSED